MQCHWRHIINKKKVHCFSSTVQNCALVIPSIKDNTILYARLLSAIMLLSRNASLPVRTLIEISKKHTYFQTPFLTHTLPLLQMPTRINEIYPSNMKRKAYINRQCTRIQWSSTRFKLNQHISFRGRHICLRQQKKSVSPNDVELNSLSPLLLACF